MSFIRACVTFVLLSVNFSVRRTVKYDILVIQQFLLSHRIVWCWIFHRCDSVFQVIQLHSFTFWCYFVSTIIHRTHLDTLYSLSYPPMFPYREALSSAIRCPESILHHASRYLKAQVMFISMPAAIRSLSVVVSSSNRNDIVISNINPAFIQSDDSAY